MSRINKVCKSCNKPFSISKKEQQRLNDRGFDMYTHCRECREKRFKKPVVSPRVQIDVNHPDALTTLALLGAMFTSGGDGN